MPTDHNADDLIHLIEEAAREEDLPPNLRGADDPTPAKDQIRRAVATRDAVRQRLETCEALCVLFPEVQMFQDLAALFRACLREGVPDDSVPDGTPFTEPAYDPVAEGLCVLNLIGPDGGVVARVHGDWSDAQAEAKRLIQSGTLVVRIEHGPDDTNSEAKGGR